MISTVVCACIYNAMAVFGTQSFVGKCNNIQRPFLRGSFIRGSTVACLLCYKYNVIILEVSTPSTCTSFPCACMDQITACSILSLLQQHYTMNRYNQSLSMRVLLQKSHMTLFNVEVSIHKRYTDYEKSKPIHTPLPLVCVTEDCMPLSGEVMIIDVRSR